MSATERRLVWAGSDDEGELVYVVAPSPGPRVLHFTIATPSPELMRILLGEVAPLDLDYDDRYLDEMDTDIALEREWQGRLRAERQTQAWKHPQPRPDPAAILDEQ